MKPGDLVHVTCDNMYFGIGIIIETEPDYGVEIAHRVLTTDGRSLFYFEEELTLLESAGETR